MREASSKAATELRVLRVFCASSPLLRVSIPLEGVETRSCSAGGAAGTKPPGFVFHSVLLCPLRLAQSRTNPQVLDTGLTAQDIQSAETLSPVDWNKIDPGTAEKDDLFMF